MQNPTKEWEMVVELAEMINELETDQQEEFIRSLYQHLDPFLSFREQQSEEQEKYLNYLYEKFVNDDTDAAKAYYDED